MGNLCGKASSSDDDPFAHPGRAVGTEAPSSSSSPRAAVPRIIGRGGSQGRTLGGGGGGGGGVEDARQAAARAAEVCCRFSSHTRSLLGSSSYSDRDFETVFC